MGCLYGWTANPSSDHQDKGAMAPRHSRHDGLCTNRMGDIHRPNTRRVVDFLDARANITTEMVMEEALAQTGQRLADAHPSRHDDGTSSYMTWIVSFLKPTKGRWTLTSMHLAARL